MALNLPAETVDRGDLERYSKSRSVFTTVRDFFCAISDGREVNRLAKPEKIAVVDEFKQELKDCQIAIATQYIGINVARVTELRKQLREAGVKMKVYKNTLARRALDELELGDVADVMEGPTAWAFSNDPVAPAKILKDFAKESDFVKMRGGVLEGKKISTDQLNALASLPSREVLLSQLVGTVAAPLRNLVGTLNAVPRNLVNVLDQVRKQKEEGAAA